MLKRVWKPLDIYDIRLYTVAVQVISAPHVRASYIVAAKSPLHAARLIYKAGWKRSRYICTGHPLNVYMPGEPKCLKELSTKGKVEER